MDTNHHFEPENDHLGLAAWVDDGRFFAVGNDGIAREYGDGDREAARLRNDISTPARPPAIEWAKPVVHDLTDAMADVGCRLQRLQALFDSNTIDLADAFVHASPTTFTEHLAQRASNIWSIYLLAGEKLAEIDDILAAIERALPPRQTSVAKHVDIVRDREWRAAVAALEVANAAQTTDETIEAAANAFRALIETRAHTPAAFREKLDIVQREGAWSAGFIIEAMFRDLDALGLTSRARAEG